MLVVVVTERDQAGAYHPVLASARPEVVRAVLEAVEREVSASPDKKREGGDGSPRRPKPAVTADG